MIYMSSHSYFHLRFVGHIWLRCIVRIRLLHSSNASSCWINVYTHAIDFDSVSNTFRVSKPAVSTTSDCPCRVRKECVILVRHFGSPFTCPAHLVTVNQVISYGGTTIFLDLNTLSIRFWVERACESTC